MTVLVTAASKHGSTREIGQVITAEIAARGIATRYRDVQDVTDPEEYGAFVIGSAIYMGRWQEEAREFLSDHRDVLEKRPVWLFSSGPVGDAEGVGLSEQEHDTLMQLESVREHLLFAGKLDRDELGFGERLVTRVVRAPEGDYRDWDAIREWAATIASELGEMSDERGDV